MVSRFLRINGMTRDDRHKVIDELNIAIKKSGAWIRDFRRFSNKSINIVFEIPMKNVHKLYSCLLDTNVELYQESKELLEDTGSQQKELSDKTAFDLIGTLQVTFIHNEPDLKIDVPPIEW